LDQLQKVGVVPRDGGETVLVFVPKKIFLFSGSAFDFFLFLPRGCSTGGSKVMPRGDAGGAGGEQPS